MVYEKETSEGSGGYVVCIILDGKPLPERADGSVEVPFDREYQIRLRNKTNKKAAARIWIDDELITDKSLIVGPGEFVDLDCNPQTKRKFKFVPTNSPEAVDEGKNRFDDPAMGVIRVEWSPERERPIQEVVKHYHHHHHYPPADEPWRIEPWPQPKPIRWATPCCAGSEYKYDDNASGSNASKVSLSASTTKVRARKLEQGATIEGNRSDQSFYDVYVDIDYSKKVVCRLVLKGFREEKTVKGISRKYCDKCGAKKQRPSARYCEMCGNKF